MAWICRFHNLRGGAYFDAVVVVFVLVNILIANIVNIVTIVYDIYTKVADINIVIINIIVTNANLVIISIIIIKFDSAISPLRHFPPRFFYSSPLLHCFYVVLHTIPH